MAGVLFSPDVTGRIAAVGCNLHRLPICNTQPSIAVLVPVSLYRVVAPYNTEPGFDGLVSQRLTAVIAGYRLVIDGFALSETNQCRE